MPETEPELATCKYLLTLALALRRRFGRTHFPLLSGRHDLKDFWLSPGALVGLEQEEGQEKQEILPMLIVSKTDT